jgi:hypothetical protein
MAATTTQLGLVTPTQGTLSGTWGDTVNNGITEYINIAIAGTLSFAGDGAITLANTTGDASASNIGSTTAQYMVIRVTGTLTIPKIITAPSYSKLYLVDNAATGSTVTFKATGQTGISIAAGETCFAYYNGTDYIKVTSDLLLGGYTTTATAGTTTTLTAASTTTQFFTGTTTQTVTLPVASTLVLGAAFSIHNNSTGDITVNSSGANLVATVTANTTCLFTCILVSGTSAASWDSDYTGFTLTLPTVRGGTGLASFTSGGAVYASSTSALTTGTLPIASGGTGSTSTTYVNLASNVTGTLPIANGGTGSTSTTYVNLASNVTGTLPVANGGTGLTAGTSGGVPYYSAAGTIASSAALTANKVLLGGGAGAAPTATTLLGTAAAVTSGSYIQALGYADTVTALGNTGVAINLDVTSGNVFTATLTGNATITLRYPVATGSSSFTLILTNDATAGRTVAWAGGTFKAPGGSVTRTTAANAVDVWFFFTPNGGTTWYYSIPMANLS